MEYYVLIIQNDFNLGGTQQRGFFFVVFESTFQLSRWR